VGRIREGACGAIPEVPEERIRRGAAGQGCSEGGVRRASKCLKGKLDPSYAILPAKMSRLPLYVVSYAPEVTGKFVESVEPVR